MYSASSLHCIHVFLFSSFTYFLLNRYWPFPVLPKEEAPQMLYNSVNTIVSLSLRFFSASSPSVIPHLVFCCVKEWSDDRFHFPEFITYCVFCCSATMTPSAFRLNGGPTLTQFNKKIMRPLEAHRCVSTMKRVYNQCKCDVFLLCGAQRFDTHLFCWIKSDSLFALRI